MKKHVLIPVLTVLLSIAGFLLRRWELSTAFEGDVSLPVSGAPATTALVVFCLLAAVLLFLLTRVKLPRGREWNWPACFAADGLSLYLVPVAAGALLVLLSAGWELYSGLLSLRLLRENGQSVGAVLLDLVLALALIPLAGSFFAIGRKNAHAGETGAGDDSMLPLVPGFIGCLWLVAAYRDHAANPVLLDYVFLLLGIISTLLGFYFTSCISFKRPYVSSMAFFSAMGILLLSVAMAGGNLFALLFYSGVCLYQLANLSLVLYNTAFHHPRRLQETASPDAAEATNPEPETEVKSDE